MKCSVSFHLLTVLTFSCEYVYSFVLPTTSTSLSASSPTTILNSIQHDDIPESSISSISHDDTLSIQRRSFLSIALLPLLTTTAIPDIAIADNSGVTTKSTSDAKVTSKIYLQFKGIPQEDDSIPTSPDTITIGLFGNDAPEATQIISQLASSTGYPAKCKPREIRTLQREQLEANKVYNACIMSEEAASTSSDSSSSNFGVTYDFSTVWRVIPNERIDMGAVAGKFIAREPPLYQLSTGVKGDNGLRHDSEGVVSVRRGSDGGFGFTIYPGNPTATTNGKKTASSSAAEELDVDNIVVGKVIEGMDVVRRLNRIPVVQSASSPFGNKSAATSTTRNSPSRACRYGSTELYCNEFKPLKKVLITNTGTIS